MSHPWRLEALVMTFLAAGCAEDGTTVARLGAGSSAGSDGGSASWDDAAMPTSGATDGGPLSTPPLAPSLDGGRPVDGSPGDADAGGAAPSSEPRGVFVAVGYGGRRVRSTDDGATWTDDVALTAHGGDDDTLLRTVTFGNGMFVAAGWRIMTSKDGSAGSWVDHPPGGDLSISNWIGAATRGESVFAAVGGYGLRSWSTDAVTWTNNGLDATASHAHGCLLFAKLPSPRFVACNDDGQRSYSLDGKQWTYATGAEDTPTGTSALAALAAGEGVYVASDGASVVVSSDGGLSWTKSTPLDAPAGGLVYAQGHFTLLGTGAVYTSKDGTSWAKHSSPAMVPSPVAYGHGTFIALTSGGRRRSVDGVAWDAPVKDPSSQTNALEWITFGPAGSP